MVCLWTREIDIGKQPFKISDKKILEAIIKWPGGKSHELKYINRELPKVIRSFYEPFVGGGAVYMSINADHYYINDKSEELISLYKLIRENDSSFYNALNEIIESWASLTQLVIDNSAYLIELYEGFTNNNISEQLLLNNINRIILGQLKKASLHRPKIFNHDIVTLLEILGKVIVKKFKRIKIIEIKKNTLPHNDIVNNIETAFKSAYYTYLRHLYNNTDKLQILLQIRIALFFFIRNYTYSGMFRYNKSGEFNVPYGGIAYNSKSLTKKTDYLKSTKVLRHLRRTTIENEDFYIFLKKYPPQKDDFIFLDPPYDSEFSEYAKSSFTHQDHIRLADYLIKECQSNWMLVIKKTEFIFNLYQHETLNITSFEKKYLVSFMNRNSKNAEHLLIRNY